MVCRYQGAGNTDRCVGQVGSTGDRPPTWVVPGAGPEVRRPTRRGNRVTVARAKPGLISGALDAVDKVIAKLPGIRLKSDPLDLDSAVDSGPSTVATAVPDVYATLSQ